ncbi:hypothetical protein FACS1894182_06620 [Bacteroidia bacterium]|nr:hypothetical protein FACS1894182_06620 [Bacteroidia bacterium]
MAGLSLPPIRLSVIIPFYNVEKYISQCLESVYSQDIPESDYEVICVNDCSPDNSRTIVLEYQQQHDNLILIEHEENKKQGGARNTGLRAARGEYVWFIDSDDFVKPNCVKHLLEVLSENNLDLVLFDFEEVDEKGGFLKRSLFDFPPREVYEGKTIFYFSGTRLNEFNGWRKMSVYVWARIVKRSLYLENDLFFYENFQGEDVPNGISCFLKAKKWIYWPEAIVLYRIRPDSTMDGKFHPDSLGYRRASAFRCLASLCKITESVEDSEIRSILEAFQRDNFQNDIRFRVLLDLNNQQRRQFFYYVRKMDDLEVIFPSIHRRIKFAITQKAGMTLLYNAFRFLRVIYRKIKK